MRKIYKQSIWYFQDGLIRLTFDDGPSDNTEKILDILDSKEIKGYFFVLPDQAEKHRDLMIRMLRRGHKVGVHSDAHNAYWFKSKKYIEIDLDKCTSRVEAITENKIEIIRSPYGRIFPWQEKIFKKNGLYHWFWSLSSVDYKDESPDVIRDRIFGQIEPGDVVLFHDGKEMNTHIIPVLEELCNSELPFEKIQ